MNKIDALIEFVADTISVDSLGVQSGFIDLDTKILGFQPKELTILAARPSLGKSAMMIEMAMSIGKTKNVGIISLEMSENLIVSRMLSNRMEVDLNSLKRGELAVSDEVKDEVSKYQIYVSEASGLNMAQIWDIVDKSGVDLDILFIDYLQLIRNRENFRARYEEIDTICQNLREMAKQKNIPVVLLAQLNRNLENRNDHTPRLSDLRDSGGIEQVADIILFLHRPAYYQVEDDGVANIIIAKNRNGPLGKIDLVWLGEYMAFRSITFDVGGF